jgi:hypothetical protein
LSNDFDPVWVSFPYFKRFKKHEFDLISYLQCYLPYLLLKNVHIILLPRVNIHTNWWWIPGLEPWSFKAIPLACGG